MGSALRGPQWPFCLTPPRPGAHLGGATAGSRSGSARGPGSWCCSGVTQPSWGSELISPGEVHRLPPGPRRVGLTRLGPACRPSPVATTPAGGHAKATMPAGGRAEATWWPPACWLSRRMFLKFFSSFGSLVLLGIETRSLLCVERTEGSSVQLCLLVGPGLRGSKPPAVTSVTRPPRGWGGYTLPVGSSAWHQPRAFTKMPGRRCWAVRPR